MPRRKDERSNKRLAKTLASSTIRKSAKYTTMVTTMIITTTLYDTANAFSIATKLTLSSARALSAKLSKPTTTKSNATWPSKSSKTKNLFSTRPKSKSSCSR